MQRQRLQVVALQRPTPLSFPLMVERFREKLSNEPLAERIARMVAELEQAAGGELVGTDHAPASSLAERADDVAASLRLAEGGAPAAAPRDGAARPARRPRRPRR